MLKDEISSLVGRKRRFYLFRIADMDTETARKLSGITLGTYNRWLRDESFVALYRRRDELSSLYKREAIHLLRRDNQLAAVLLEEQILTKMKEELESGDYNLLRTNLAREVYSKLISDLDVNPQIQSLTWEQRIGQLVRIENKEYPNAPIIETTSIQQNQLTEGIIISQDEQTPSQVEEESEEE